MLFHRLVQEPYNLTLDQIANLTDESVMLIYSEPPKIQSSYIDKEELKEDLSLPFREAFVRDMIENGRTRIEAEEMFRNAFPDYQGD